MNTHRTSIKLILAGVVFAVAAFGCGFLYWNIVDKNQTIAAVASELEYTLAREVQLRSIKNVVEETAADREVLAAHAISSGGTVPFLEELERVAGLSGAQFEITGVAIEPMDSITKNPAVNKYFELLTVHITAEGSWREVFHALSLIESLPYIATANQVSLRKQQSSTNSLWALSGTFAFVKHK